MKAKIGIPLKVTILFVVIISASLIFGLGAVNYTNQMQVFDKSTQNQAEYYANIIEVLLRNYKDFDEVNLTGDLTNIIYDVQPIKSISINMINNTKYNNENILELDEFIYIESYDSPIKLKDISSYERLNMHVIEEVLEAGGNPNHTIMSKTKLADGTSWLIIMPLTHNETFVVGTCAIVMSWAEESETYERELMNLIYGSFIFICFAVGIIVLYSRILNSKRE